MTTIMENSSSNDDDEPRVCTVFSSNDTGSGTSKSIFDSISYSNRKEEIPEIENPATSICLEQTNDEIKDPELASNSIEDNSEVSAPQQALSRNSSSSPIPTANVLFSDAPEVNFIEDIVTEPNLPDASSATTENVPSDISTVKPMAPNEITSPVTSPDLTYKPIPVTYEDAYSAWIPTPKATTILKSVCEAVKGGTYFPDKSNITTPGIIYEDDLVDKVAVNMARIFGESEANKRKILSVDSVSQDQNGLRELVKLGCYRAAINLTKRLLTLVGQGAGKVGHYSKHSPYSLQVWFMRISLFVRIREFGLAASELEAFQGFSNPDMYYEYYPETYDGKQGTLVPFHFRLLAAETFQYNKKHGETQEKLMSIMLTTKQIIENLENGYMEDGSAQCNDKKRSEFSLDLWKKREVRVYYSLVNAALFCKRYHEASEYLRTLLVKDSGKSDKLKAAIGRLYLQIGDLNQATYYFQQAAEDESSENREAHKVARLLDSSALALSKGSYDQAYFFLETASKIQPENYMVSNNMAVCLLFMGKVKESLSIIETLVKSNAPLSLQENLLLNLSSIYELDNSDSYKKNAMLKLISEYKGDGVNLASLKMPNLI